MAIVGGAHGGWIALQRRRVAVRLAGNDKGDDLIPPPQTFKVDHFIVDPPGSSAVGRAYDHQIPRRAQFPAQRRRHLHPGQIRLIPEHAQATTFRERFPRFVGYVEGLQLLLYPARPFKVAMRIADKSVIREFFHCRVNLCRQAPVRRSSSSSFSSNTFRLPRQKPTSVTSMPTEAATSRTLPLPAKRSSFS